MNRYALLLLGLFLVACDLSKERPRPSPNRWADERLWPVLEAQEHRDTDALCALLKHEAPEVRQASALAFASVQDTLGIPCLIAALRDDAATVRATAVYALGFVADSLALERMGELAVYESDPAVQRAFLSASFLALQRSGRLKDPAAILYYLENSKGHERVRAADALRRLPDSVLLQIGPEILDLVRKDSGDVRRFAALALGKMPLDPYQFELSGLLYRFYDVGLWVNVIKALSPMKPAFSGTFTKAMGDPMVAAAALDGIDASVPLWGEDLLMYAEWSPEPRIRIALLGLGMKNVSIEWADSLQTVLLAIRDTSSDAYQRSTAISALRHAPVRNAAADLLTPMITLSTSSIERIEAFRAAMAFYADKTTGQVELIQEVLDRSDDPGLLSAVCEEIMAREKYRGFHWLFTDGLTSKLAGFQLPRDLEAQQLIHQTVAFLKDLPPPAHQPPPFNHPIDPAKLRALPQGQRYRITTTKGTIVIATDVNDCPGSSLAFDSLVTAGYYNGKAFHRMVPNFVVQGGCPRGDGYGGMPWTLRTEIGRKPFTAGSVGLASAGRDTESCQFFITHSATPHLDGRYTRFGEVVEGMDLVWRLQVGDVMGKVERVE